MRPAVALSTLALVATSTLGAVLGPAGVAPAQAAGPVTVDWPAQTAFNPTVTPYTFTVTDAPAGSHLFSTWGPQDADVYHVYGAPVPASGTVTVDFTDAEGHGAVRVWTCPDATWSTDCTEAARSPELDAWYDMRVVDLQGTAPSRRSGLQHVDIWYGPQAPLAGTPTATWELLGPDRQPLSPAVTGTLSAADLASHPDTWEATIPFTIPDGLPSGTYYLDVHMSVDTADFGHLEGDMETGQGGPMEVRVDNEAPTLTVRKTPPVIYPAHDQYLDYLTLYAKTSEPTTGTLEITDAHGHRVFRSPGHRFTDDDTSYYDTPVWNGRHGGAIVPEGRYTATLTATDDAGNAGTWSASVRVSHRRLQWTSFRHTITAAKSKVGKPYVGRCSTLASPARGGPRGSLGFYSQTKCRGGVARSAVATDHGLYIPKAFQNHYAWVRVTLNGGPATSSAADYIVLGYLNPHSGKVVYPRVFRRGDGAHHGQRMNVVKRVVYDLSTEHPYVIWWNGLTAGSRYDVRSYTVEVRYQALR